MTRNVVGTWATSARCTRFVVATFKNRMNEDFGPARNLPDLHGRSFFSYPYARRQPPAFDLPVRQE